MLKKKIKIFPGWYLPVSILLIGVVVVFFFFLYIQTKEAELTRYQQAPICENKPACRQIKTALLLKTGIKNTDNVRTGSSKYGGGSSRTTNITYYFQVSFEGRQTEVYTATKFASIKNLFDLPNIYIPELSQTDFQKKVVDVNPPGRQVKIELWESQITFIFTDIQQFDNNGVIFLPVSDSGIPQSPSATPESTKKVAIPTTNHPLIALRAVQENLVGVFLAVLIILMMTILLTLRFRKSYWPPDRRNHSHKMAVVSHEDRQRLARKS